MIFARSAAQSAADQAAARARQESDRNQAEYARQTSVARAQYDAEVEAAAKAAYAHATAVTYRLQDGREVAWFDELDDAACARGI